MDTTCTLDGELVLGTQLVHTKNGNNVLERLVLLEDLLDTGSGAVVLLTDDTRIQHAGLGVERIDGRVDTQLGDTTGQHSGSVQMGEGGGRGRISQIVSRHVDGLDGSDGSLLGSGDTLLHLSHIYCQRGLVTDGRGNTSEQGRHLGTSLGETENVVNEEQHILTFLVTEILSDGQTSESNTGTGSGGLVHLTEHQCDFGWTIELDDTYDVMRLSGHVGV